MAAISQKKIHFRFPLPGLLSGHSRRTNQLQENVRQRPGVTVTDKQDPQGLLRERHHLRSVLLCDELVDELLIGIPESFEGMRSVLPPSFFRTTRLLWKSTSDAFNFLPSLLVQTLGARQSIFSFEFSSSAMIAAKQRKAAANIKTDVANFLGISVEFILLLHTGFHNHGYPQSTPTYNHIQNPIPCCS